MNVCSANNAKSSMPSSTRESRIAPPRQVSDQYIGERMGTRRRDFRRVPRHTLRSAECALADAIGIQEQRLSRLQSQSDCTAKLRLAKHGKWIASGIPRQCAARSTIARSERYCAHVRTLAILAPRPTTSVAYCPTSVLSQNNGSPRGHAFQGIFRYRPARERNVACRWIIALEPTATPGRDLRSQSETATESVSSKSQTKSPLPAPPVIVIDHSPKPSAQICAAKARAEYVTPSVKSRSNARCYAAATNIRHTRPWILQQAIRLDRSVA